MVFGSTLTFVTVLLFLIHDDQAQIGERGKKCGSRTYDHIDLACFCTLALIIFFSGRQCGIHDTDPVTESLIEPKQCLVGQSDLRDQHDRLASSFYHFADELHIHFRFAAAGDAMDQIGLSSSGIKIRKHFRNDGLLFRAECIMRRLQGLHFHRIPIAFGTD